MIFFTGDTHFWHRQIINYARHEFSSVEEMNDAIIGEWNSVVGEKDTVFHVGDFSFAQSNKAINELLDRLNGKIALILGNHDNKMGAAVKDRFVFVKDVYNLKVSGYIPGEHQKIFLCHYGMRVWRNHHHGAWHLYGHSHGSLPPHGKSFDVGVDSVGYKPLSYWQVKERMEKLQIAIEDQHKLKGR